MHDGAPPAASPRSADIAAIRLSLSASPGRPAMRTAAVIPFVACAVIGYLTLLVPPVIASTSELVITGVLMVVVVGGAVALPWERLPVWSHSIMPLAFFAVIALMRDSSGATSSALTPMVAIPVLWLVLFGDHWALHVAAIATALVFVLPVLLVGPPAYPVSDWRRALLWMAVVWLIGPYAQRVVAGLGHRERQLTRLLLELDDVHRQWRSLSDELPDTAILVVNEQLRYVLISGSGAFRQGIAGWEGRTLSETSSAENIAILEPLYRGALAGRRGTGVLSATLSGDQHEVVVVPYRQAGAPRALVVARDVSEASRREQQIRALHRRIERLIEDAPTGMCVAALDGSVTRVNPALREILGAVPQGATIQDLGLVRDLAATLAAARRSPARRQSAEITLRPEGSPARDLAVDVVLLDAAERGDGDGDDEILLHVHDISERRRFEEQLRHLAQHDPLTGLANRRSFDETLQDHLRACARYGARGAVLMLDLDHFKEVNDRFGHDVGDQLIVSVGQVLRRELRESDTVSRLGGDEFAVLLPRADRAEAELVARRVVDAVRAEVSAFRSGAARPISVSVGVVVVSDARMTAKELLVAADMTMYDAKEAGRDRYEVFDALDHGAPRTAARINWAVRIREALQQDSFVLHAQPVVDLVTRRTTGAELLLRMVDADGVLIPPARFLYIAERMGLAPQVDRWVVQRSLALIGDLPRPRRPRIHLNVSARSLDDPRFSDDVAALVEAADVDPAGLTFEITETAAIAHMERARGFARRLQQLGCRLALDDFGAGHASFYYLKHLPFDVVKIDGEFVRSCTTDESDRLVIAAVVAFSRGTARQVVAEFIGDELTATTLRDMGVDLGQGYHLGRPVPWEEFSAAWAAEQDAAPAS